MADDATVPEARDTSPAWLTQVQDPTQRQLVAWVLRSLDALEQTDFGELEPVGVAAPIGGK